MPPPLLIDLNKVDLGKTHLTQEQIYELLPQRYEFMLLEGICHLDEDARAIIGYRDIRADDWWFRGHVPGRPLLPGVLMLEMGAQSSALMARLFGGSQSFIAFGGVDNCKFREAVAPGTRLYFLCVAAEIRPRRIISEVQGVVEGRLIFEARITGLIMR
ncbi:MAG: 3-hydroxyacyl-ACP dehydratase FabZ family protein [Planctomycetota bacterium]|jgi:3-hydroxyacyl-[acyl-carrier-protein] dehydratase